MTVVKVPMICVHMDPAPSNCSNSYGPSVSGRGGGVRAPMSHMTSEAHGSATENLYNHDRRFPLRKIIWQLLEEAQHLSVLT